MPSALLLRANQNVKFPISNHGGGAGARAARGSAATAGDGRGAAFECECILNRSALRVD